MLEDIRIRGLGVIDEAEVELGAGLTVLTGETGAGKTMVLTGLGLLLGGRADPGAVRSGAARAVVEGTLRVDPGGPVAGRVLAAGGELDGDSLLLARTVSSEGRSRAYAGGRAVPATLLGELAQEMVAVHGQGDQQRLLRPARQRETLDRLAGEPVAALLDRWTVRLARLRALEADLDEVVSGSRERAQEAGLLRFGLTEVEAVAPRPGEDRELAVEEERLGHADGLRTAAEQARAALAGDEAGPETVDALGLVSQARRAVELQRQHDGELAGLADRLAEASYLLADVAADLASYAAGLDTDPARLATVQRRRAELSGLTRRYGDDVDAVLEWTRTASRRLLELEDDGPRVEALRSQRAALRAELGVLAAQLSAARAAAARRLAAEVTGELSALAMPDARVEVRVSRRPDPDGLPVEGEPVAFGPAGVDEVEVLLSPHPQVSARPLHRVASGGELSRVMLAVEVVVAAADPVPTAVFDEVDAGVGGRAAVEVGRRLAALARFCQVVVVTHLPQVAAFADRHLVVVKSDDGRVGRSGVAVLDDTGRVRELSRMLAGLEGSATAHAHAEELLATANDSKGAAD